MTDLQKRKRRIQAAQELADLCHSGERVSNDSHRQAWIHDQISDAVKQACAKNGGGQHFTQGQLESLTEIAFNIAFLVDPKNRRKTGVVAGIKQGWVESPLASKVAIVGTSITIIGAIGGAAIWLWSMLPAMVGDAVEPTQAEVSSETPEATAPAANTPPTPATPDDATPQ